ncbi:Putative expansin-B2, partial [Linum perenne]
IDCSGRRYILHGRESGSCYKVKCKSNPDCSKRPVNIVITDQCPSTNEHFDMSGHAFGAMALPGKEESLRCAGKINVKYRRYPCKYRNIPVTFHVDAGSNPYYLSILVEFLKGDGTICSMAFKSANSEEWIQMEQSWGALWKHSCSSPLVGPISFQITSGETKQVTVFNNVLPVDWHAGQDYYGYYFH